MVKALKQFIKNKIIQSLYPGWIIYYNGKFLQADSIHVPLYGSIMTGGNVFDVLRTFNQKIFRFDNHYHRLKSAADFMGLDLSENKERLFSLCKEIIKKNKQLLNGQDCLIYINVLRGISACRLRVSGGLTVISVLPVTWSYKDIYKKYAEGIAASIAKYKLQPSIYASDTKIKSGSNPMYGLGYREIYLNKSKKWLLFTDQENNITEGISYNFFVLRDKMLITAPASDVVEGVSRNFVMELSRGMGMGVEERLIRIDELQFVQEAFFTATSFCILPVIDVGGIKIGNGAAGKFTQTITSKWVDIVGKDFRIP